MKKFFAVLAAASLGIAAFCAVNDYSYASNVSYKSGDNYVNEMCRLDVAYVKGAKERPVIVWFHGGGLTEGSRHIPDHFRERDYVIVPVEYRLYPGASVAEILDDCAASVAWVFRNIEAYGGSTSKVYLSGHSAGGYIVNMLALDKSWMAPYGIDPDESFAAVAPYSGQVITHFTQRASEGLDALTPTIDNMAPLYHVRGDACPFLVLSGDRELELYGRYEETAYFVRMMKLRGHKDIIFYEFDGFTHGSMAQPANLIFMEYIAEREK